MCFLCGNTYVKAVQLLSVQEVHTLQAAPAGPIPYRLHQHEPRTSQTQALPCLCTTHVTTFPVAVRLGCAGVFLPTSLCMLLPAALWMLLGLPDPPSVCQLHALLLCTVLCGHPGLWTSPKCHRLCHAAPTPLVQRQEAETKGAQSPHPATAAGEMETAVAG